MTPNPASIACTLPLWADDALSLWIRRLDQLLITEAVTFGSVTAARVDNRKYVVIKDDCAMLFSPATVDPGTLTHIIHAAAKFAAGCDE